MTGPLTPWPGTAGCNKRFRWRAKAFVNDVINDYRVESIAVKIEMPKALTATDRKVLERASKTCPVYRALDPALKVCAKYVWPGAGK
jgi:hypothetical protein